MTSRLNRVPEIMAASHGGGRQDMVVIHGTYPDVEIFDAPFFVSDKVVQGAAQASLAGVVWVDARVSALGATMDVIRSLWPTYATAGGSLCLMVQGSGGKRHHALRAMVQSLAREAGDGQMPFRINALELPDNISAQSLWDAVGFIHSPDADFITGAWLKLSADVTPEPTAPILVTGASDGIGAACAHKLAVLGHEVIVSARDLNATRIIADRIRAEGLKARSFQLDCTLESDWQRAVRELGPLGGIVSNVGACRLGPTALLDTADIGLMLDANIRNHRFAMEYGLQLMREGGVLLFTGSVAALKASSGNAVYSATKAAIADLMEEYQGTAKSKQIRIQLIHPGLVFNDNVSRKHGPAKAQKMYDAVVGQTPLKRAGQEADIANAMAALMTGKLQLDPLSALVCDGGFSA